MFRKKNPNQHTLQDEIDRVTLEMKGMDPKSAMYTTSSENLERLYKMKASEKQHRVHPDSIFNGAVSMLGIGSIVAFERNNVLTSKALGFVRKPRP